MKIRVALVGLGDHWESRHCPALISLADRYEIRAVYSEVAARAKLVARRFDIEAMLGVRQLARRSDIDAALVLSRGWQGSLPLLACCEAGKAVYCAAELDIDPQKARQIKQRVEHSGVAFMAEFPRRYAPATLRLKELIATRLGTPRMLFCHSRYAGQSLRNVSPGNYARPRTSTREMIELVDWCRYIVGAEPTSVFGVKHLTAKNTATNDYRMLSLDFSGPDELGAGALAHVSFGTYLHGRWPESASFRRPPQMQVCCERGVAFVDLPTTLVWFDEAGHHTESLDSDRPIGEQLLMQFHRSVTSLVRKTNDLEDAYRSLQIVLAGDRSFREARRIANDEFDER